MNYGEVIVPATGQKEDMLDKAMPTYENDNGKEDAIPEKEVSQEDEKTFTEMKSAMKGFKVGSDLTGVQFGASFCIDKSGLMLLRDNMMNCIHLLIDAKHINDPLERMIQIVKYYLSTFSLEPFGKKPLNPILGEIVRGTVTHGDADITECLGEQVSHHPPASALNIKNQKHGVEVDMYTDSKASFWGKHLKVEVGGKRPQIFRLKNINNNGQDEEYHCEWPDLFIRIFRFNSEFCGKPTITCPQTGLVAHLKFKDKTPLVGQWHVVEGHIIHKDNPKKHLYEFSGTWNNSMTFVNMTTKNKEKWNRKEVTNCVIQLPSVEGNEPLSENVWQGVIEALRKGDTKTADRAKSEVEEKQRVIAKKNKEDGIQHKPMFFERVDGVDVYRIKNN